MDAAKFDRLARALAGSTTRRGTLAAMLAAAFPAVGRAQDPGQQDGGRAAANDRERGADDDGKRRVGRRDGRGRGAARDERDRSGDRDQPESRIASERSPDPVAAEAEGAAPTPRRKAPCTATGRPCSGTVCQECCGRASIAVGGGKRLCWCRGKGAKCGANGECCTGRCQGGTCAGKIGAAGKRCTTGDRCPTGTTCRAYAAGSGGPKGTFCLKPDRKPCGTAGECAANACAKGVCGAECAAAGGVCPAAKPVCCAAGCTNTATDAANCGRCGDACAPGGDRCQGGECFCGQGAACAAGSAAPDCCAEGCTDTETDSANCGECGEACTAPETCGGDGTPGRCGCTPRICAADYPGQCGAALEDGCGGELDCSGACAAPQTCGGGDTADRCGCTPTTCAAIYRELCGSDEFDCDYGICGTFPDGCGGTLECGSPCPPCFACENGRCVYKSGALCGSDVCCDICCADPYTGTCGEERCSNGLCCPFGSSCCVATDGTGGWSCRDRWSCPGGGWYCCPAGNTCCGNERCCKADADCAGHRVNGVQTTCDFRNAGAVAGAGCCRLP